MKYKIDGKWEWCREDEWMKAIGQKLKEWDDKYSIGEIDSQIYVKRIVIWINRWSNITTDRQMLNGNLLIDACMMNVRDNELRKKHVMVEPRSTGRYIKKDETLNGEVK